MYTPKAHMKLFRKPTVAGTNEGVLINPWWIQLFMRSSTLFDPYPIFLFLGFRLWDSKKIYKSLETFSVSSVKFAGLVSTPLEHVSFCLAGTVSDANVLLERGHSWQALSEGWMCSCFGSRRPRLRWDQYNHVQQPMTKALTNHHPQSTVQGGGLHSSSTFLSSVASEIY